MTLFAPRIPACRDPVRNCATLKSLMIFNDDAGGSLRNPVCCGLRVRCHKDRNLLKHYQAVMATPFIALENEEDP